MNGEPTLRVENLVTGYEPDVPIVRGANISVAAGEIVAILGPNGAGKSTLIKSVAGLIPKFSGAVFLDGADVTRLPGHLLVRHGLAFVPQTDNVFAAMSVADNFALAAAILPRHERHARIREMYAFFPVLAGRRNLRAGHLSGGERQMLAIARALMVRPKLLVLDEASAGLSPKMVETVFLQLKVIRQAGVTVLLVEQNVRAALAISDRAYVLAEGENRHEGRAADLWNDPVIAELYLGAARTGEAVGP
jgi:branched-chain amino acid transport system ATP-binding protein